MNQLNQSTCVIEKLAKLASESMPVLFTQLTKLSLLSFELSISETPEVCFQVMSLLTQWQNCNYGALMSPMAVYCHIYFLPLALSLFLFFFIFSPPPCFSYILFFFFLFFFLKTIQA